MKQEQIIPSLSTTFTPGAILENQWGYEQTNYNFFCIIERTQTPGGEIWLKMQPMTKTVEKGDPLAMETKETPLELDTTKKPVRRKLYISQGEERGCSMRAGDTGGWARLWNGKAKSATHYA